MNGQWNQPLPQAPYHQRRPPHPAYAPPLPSQPNSWRGPPRPQGPPRPLGPPRQPQYFVPKWPAAKGPYPQGRPGPSAQGPSVARPPQQRPPLSYEDPLPPPPQGPGSYRYNLRSAQLAGGPGPEFLPSPSSPTRSEYSPPSNSDHRISQYSMSVYSEGSPETSPNAPPVPNFSEMQQALARREAKSQQPAETGKTHLSSFYSHQPDIQTVETIREEEEARSLHSGLSSASDSVVIDFFDAIKADHIREDDEHGVVRQASLGKRHHSPRLTTVGPTDKDAPPIPRREYRRSSTMPSLSTGQSRLNAGEGFDSLQASSSALGLSHLVPAPLTSSKSSTFPRSISPASAETANTAIRSASPGSNAQLLPSPPQATHLKASRDQVRTPSPQPPPSATQSPSPFSSPENRTMPPGGGKLFLVPARQKSLSDRIGQRKPTNLNIKAVRDGQKERESATSLPGLIHRALKMAANIEKGQTTGHQSDRFGNDLLNELSKKGKSTASLTSMLDGFTFSPTVHNDASKPKGQEDGPFSNKFESARPAPSGLRNESFPSSKEKSWSNPSQRRNGKKTKKCCGIPLWLVVVLAISAIILVALAVILPIALIVIPNQKKSPPETAASCSTKLTCNNGGVAVSGSSGSCHCICTDNFTGQDCNTANTAGCGTVHTDAVPSATIGSGLAPLINNAQKDFNISLNATAILGTFYDSDLSCNSQNALVGLKTNTKRQEDASLEPRNRRKRTSESDRVENQPPLPTITSRPDDSEQSQFQRRQQNGQGVVTSAGLWLAGTETAPAGSQPTPTGALPKGKGPPGFNNQAPDVVNFARTAVLYVLQASNSLDAAVSASNQLVSYYGNTGDLDPNKISLGGGWTANLVTEQITDQGKTIGKGT